MTALIERPPGSAPASTAQGHTPPRNPNIPLHIGAWKAMAWSGVVLVLTMIVGQWLIAGFIPPPDIHSTPEEIKQIFIDRQWRIRFGCVFMCLGWGMWVTFGVSIVLVLRAMETGWPIITLGSLALIASGLFAFILVPLTWATMALRPEVWPAELMQFMNDWAWLNYLFTYPPFLFFMLLIGVTILRDPRKFYPRWVGYYNIWSGVMLVPAGMVALTLDGPFAYNGLAGFWIVTVEWFTWCAVMAFTTIPIINKIGRGEIDLNAPVEAETDEYAEPLESAQ